ncbi:uncharacterized protein LOC131857660 [Cryptomeria japonica]|uniref:uncharacterized protein LOC131857660 n=1 Tax=Cryptomeria japonica TaxID=3369 RepID=UPI0027DA66A6|nr:uncharacterized protein LOC131857660 [Cryptomeria japonica]
MAAVVVCTFLIAKNGIHAHSMWQLSVFGGEDYDFFSKLDVLERPPSGEEKGSGQAQNSIFLGGRTGSVAGQYATGDSGSPLEGESSDGREPDVPLDSGDPGGGPRPREGQIAAGKGNGQKVGHWAKKCPSNAIKSQSQTKVWKKVDNSLKASPFDGLDQEKQSQVGRTEEVSVRELGNDMKKGDNEKTAHQEKEQSGKDSDDGEKESQVSSQSKEKEKDKIEQNSDKIENRNNSQKNKGDNQSKDNKEEGDNFNSVSNSFESENGAGWIQDAQPDNILDQGLSEISLASPAQIYESLWEPFCVSQPFPPWGKGESEELSKKGRNKGKRKRIVMDLDILEFEAESFEGKFIKSKKGKGTGKQTQRKKNITKGGKSDINQILIDSDEEAEEVKNDNGQGKEGDDILVVGSNEDLNTQDIGSLKKDMNVVKRATIGDKPLLENVKELAVTINNAEAIENMDGTHSKEDS